MVARDQPSSAWSSKKKNAVGKHRTNTNGLDGKTRCHNVVAVEISRFHAIIPFCCISDNTI